MEKSVLNGSYLKKEQVQPYEISQRQQKKERKVNLDKLLSNSFFSIHKVLFLRLKEKRPKAKNGTICPLVNLLKRPKMI
jgi:hypothetical protein